MIAIIIQARMGSTRLPGKIMKTLAGKPVLWHTVERCRQSQKADQVIVASTLNLEDDAVEKFCKENKILYYRGSSENVLERYYQAAKRVEADVIVRVTSDCPLIDPFVIDNCIGAFQKSGSDYLGNNIDPEAHTFPRGLDVEVFSFKSLEKAYRNAMEIYEKEHVTQYIWENKKKEFKIGASVTASPEYARDYRFTVDYKEDFQLMEKIYNEFYKEGEIIDVKKVLLFLDKHLEIVKINAHCEQKKIK
ncbi:MAG: glycosyltransferase family protein [bacterium]|nr:glycosyltransferase family protein [bacterium]